MKRGEVWWVNFDPSVGGEIRKKRPAVIVSND
nr:type II toxin-antitoxin system PemK/MazF family toxin [Gemmatimonadota bacterium]